MVRASQRLHPARAVPVPRPAATMLLLRDSAAGPEVLMTRRADRANFAAGAYVFPGGAIDPQDHLSHGLAVHRPGQSGDGLTQAIAAIRESFEEMGILLAWRADGRPAGAADVASLDRVPPGGESFASQCAARGLRLAADRLCPLARWIADPNNPKRFDTAFFVARMPEDQWPVADDTEQFEPQWVRPAQALARHHAGAFSMVFPTVRTLERLSAHASVASILQACAGERPLTHNATRTGRRGGLVTRLTDDEPGHGELALVCPDGQVEHCLDWQHEAPVPLLRNVQRLTAADDATGHGAPCGGLNSYLVGDASAGFVVIDGGPGDAAHLARWRELAGGDLRQAIRLDAAGGCALPGRFVLQGSQATHTLAGVTLPGGGQGLLLEEDGLLFTGPQAAADGMDDVCRAHGITFILPARGHVRAVGA